MAAVRSSDRRWRIAARRADFIWFGVLLVLAGLAADVWIDCRKPEWHDEEYGHRRSLLRAQVAEHPDRPILLGLGSSRVGLGFRPEALPELCTAEGRPVIPFNGSHLAGGPVMNQVMLRRFVRDGVRPRWLVVEAAPLLLNHESPGIATTAATAFDLPYTLPYLPLGKVAMVYARGRINPFYKHRQYVMETYAPASPGRGWPATTSRWARWAAAWARCARSRCRPRRSHDSPPIRCKTTGPPSPGSPRTRTATGPCAT